MPKAEQTLSTELAVLNAHAGQINNHPRFLQVEGDTMAPTLTYRHLVAVVPVSKWRSDGIYVLDIRGLPTILRCQSLGPDGVRITKDNPRYVGWEWSWPEFEAVLLGKVAAICNVVEPTLLGRA